MKKNTLIAGCMSLLFGSALHAQTNSIDKLNLNYTNGLYQYTSNDNLSGTARYRGLNGAMGALGGDLSATIDNPAGTSVFLSSQASMTGSAQNSQLQTEYAGNKNTTKNSDFNLSQAGAVMVFRTGQSDQWKNFAFSINYQQQNKVNDILNIQPNNIMSGKDKLEQIYMEENGTSSVTNFNFAGNYNDKIYVGLGLNFHSFDMSRFERISEYSSEFKGSFNYNKDYSPYTRSGSGLSVGVGIIGRVSPEIRLGFAYESPKWYREINEGSYEYFIDPRKDSQGDYYIVDREYKYFINDLNSSQKFTGSAAFVLGKKGLINVDYTYNDFSTAKFMPEKDFSGENNYLDNYVKGSSTLKIGGEARFDNLSLRGGFRYQQSPFKSISLKGVQGEYKPYGDIMGYSIGLGYNFNNLYIDASYNLSSQKRNYALYGNYYELNGNINANDLLQGVSNPTKAELDNAALKTLSRNMTNSGYATSIKDITQKQGNFTFTVGLRF